jgi:predicted PurR-regulated permease PerM
MTLDGTVSTRITTATFVRLLAVIFGLLLVWALRDIILLLFLSMILAAAIGPWIDALSRRGLPRPVGVLIVYSAIVGLLVAIILLLIPAVTREAASLATRFPDYYQRVVDFFSSREAGATSLSGASSNFSALSRGVFAGLKGVAGGFGSFIIVLVITFYFTVGEENLRRFWLRLAPVSQRERLSRITATAVERISNWFRGQLVVSLVVGSVSYLALTIIGIPDALLLSIVAGVAAFVPLVGAAIGILPAVFVALTVSVTKALIVLVVAIPLYQLTANVLVPKLFARAVGLNPVVIVIVMLIGAKLAGGLGLILAIPVSSIIDVVVREYRGELAEAGGARAR